MFPEFDDDDAHEAAVIAFGLTLLLLTLIIVTKEVLL